MGKEINAILGAHTIIMWAYDRYQTCFLRINVHQVPREMLNTKGEARGFQQLPSDLANINAYFNGNEGKLYNQQALLCYNCMSSTIY